MLAQLPGSLGERDRSGSRLFKLFTPEPKTAPLFRLISPVFRGGRKRDFAWSVLQTLLTLSVGLPVAAVGLVAVFLFTRVASVSLWLAVALGPVSVASLVCLVWVIAILRVANRSWLPALRQNGFGICTGLTSPRLRAAKNKAAFEGLTLWMHRTVQAAAGRPLEDGPLTFGELWSAGSSDKPEEQFVAESAPRAIELAMIASDISRNRTVQLPFIETPSPIYVDLKVLARYFPGPIIEWIREHQGPYDARIGRPTADIVRLPAPGDLPVVFAARLSLSFPVLLSAVPLLTPDFARGPDTEGLLKLRELWLSDGGLTSNFPVHFFDSPMPTRPTFCLNLVDFDAELSKVAAGADPAPGSADTDQAAADAPTPATKPIEIARAEERTADKRPTEHSGGDPQPSDPVWGLIDLARDNRIRPAPFASFDGKGGIISFFKTLVDTARFWSDNQMLAAPGVRDRVVNIALRDDEGGLNLNMTRSVIADLDYRGRAAGLLISSRFDPDARNDPETGKANAEMFENHRWVRYRNFMAALEDATRRFVAARRGSDAAAGARGEASLTDLIDNAGNPKIGYKPPAKARPFFHDQTKAFETFAMSMADSTRADESMAFDRQQTDRAAHRRQASGGAPRPKMRLTLRPLADNDPRAEWASLPDRHAAADHQEP